MTKPLTKIPDIAYSIEGDLITLEQSTGCGEFTLVELHKIHLELLAEQMGLYKPVHQAHNALQTTGLHTHAYKGICESGMRSFHRTLRAAAKPKQYWYCLRP